MKRTFLTSSLVFVSHLHAAETQDTSLWAMIQQGGWAMFPLAACSLALLYIAIHCYRETRLGAFISPNASNVIGQAFANADFQQALAATQSRATVFERAAHSAIPKLNLNDPQGSIEPFESEFGSRVSTEEAAVARWIHYLSVVANVAPMIGLLGTVSGMIGGFQTMSAGGMGRPELFAGDIGEALITTATGLCIGIPAMISHSIFNNRLSASVAETIRQANTLVDQLPSSPSTSPTNFKTELPVPTT